MRNGDKNYTVRTATLVDVEAIVAMWSELARLHSQYNTERWRWSDTAVKEFENFLINDSLAKENAVILVAVDGDDRPVGFLAGSTGKAASVLAAKTRAEVSDLFVLPEFRRIGLATMLVDRAMEIFRSRKVEYVVLSVACGNDEAIKLYDKYEFEPCMVQLFKKLN